MDLAPEILIVDDDDDIRETIRDVLEDEGYEVATACDGFAALQYLERESADHRPLPELILLDVMMPVMNGHEFQQAKSERPDLASIPVVVISASLSAAEAFRLGARDVIQKPLALSSLLDAALRFGSAGRARRRQQAKH